MVDISRQEVAQRDITPSHRIVAFDPNAQTPEAAPATDSVLEFINRFVTAVYVRDALGELSGTDRLNITNIQGLTGERIRDLLDALLGDQWQTGGTGLSDNAIEPRFLNADSASTRKGFRDRINAGSKEGDDIQSIVVNSLASLTSALTQQESTATALIIEFTADITYSGSDYVDGDICYVPPESNSIERWFNLGGGTADVPDAERSGNTITHGLFTQSLWDVLTAGSDIQRTSIASAANLEAILTARPNTNTPLIAVVTAAVTTTISSVSYNLSVGDVLYFAPRSASHIELFNLYAPDATVSAAGALTRGGLLTSNIWNLIRNGNNPQVEFVTTAARFSSQVAQQATSSRPLWMVIRASFTAVVGSTGYSVVDGEIMYVAPYSTVAHRFWNTRDLGGNIGIEPNRIAAVGDLSGDYRLAVWNLNTAYLTARGVRQYEIWVGSRGVHTVSEWTPTTDFTVDFNINTTEQTTIGLKATDTIVPVQWVPRLPSGSAEFSMIRTTFLHIGEQGGSGEDDRLFEFSSIELTPGGIPGRNYPEQIVIRFGEKQTDITFTGVTVATGLGTFHTYSGDVSSGQVIIAELSNAEREALDNNTGTEDTERNIDITLSHAGGSIRYRYKFQVNNVSFEDAQGGGMRQFGSGAGQIAVEAEGNNTSAWPKSKIPALDDNEVVTAKVADGAITEPKMADDSVPERAIVDGAISTGKVKDGAITEAKVDATLLAKIEQAQEFLAGDPDTVDATDANADMNLLFKGELYGNRLTPKMVEFRPLEVRDLQAVWGQNVTGWGGIVNNLPNNPVGTVIFTTFQNRNRWERAVNTSGGYTVLPTSSAGARWPTDNSHLVANKQAAIDAADKDHWFGYGSQVYVAEDVVDRRRDWLPLSALSFGDRVALTEMRLDPGVVYGHTLHSFAGDYKLSVENPSALPTCWYRILVDDNQVLVRTPWTYDSELPFSITPLIGKRIADALGGTGHPTVEVIFYDAATGGNELGRDHFPLDVVEVTHVEQELKYDANLLFNTLEGTRARVTLTGNTTLRVQGDSVEDTAILRVIQDGTGGRTLTLSSGLAYIATAPTLNTNAGKSALLEFRRINNVWKYVGMTAEDEEEASGGGVGGWETQTFSHTHTSVPTTGRTTRTLSLPAPAGDVGVFNVIILGVYTHLGGGSGSGRTASVNTDEVFGVTVGNAGINLASGNPNIPDRRAVQFSALVTSAQNITFNLQVGYGRLDVTAYYKEI